MIPNHPKWSCLTKPQNYPKRVLPRPPSGFGQIEKLKVGPIGLGDSRGNLTARFWVIYQEDSEVFIRGAIDDNDWGTATLLFEEVDPIEVLDFSFDQLGREIVFYQVGTELRLWYFDSIVSSFIKIVLVSDGSYPNVSFDIVYNTNNPQSDVIICYVKNNTIYQRIQRDRFDIEYSCKISHQGIKILSCGLTENNRFQIIYNYPDPRDGGYFKKVYESESPVISSFSNDDFSVGFTLPDGVRSECIIAKGAPFTLFEQSDMADSQSIIVMVRAEYSPSDPIGQPPTISVVTEPDTSIPVITFVSPEHIDSGVYSFVFIEDPANSSNKLFSFYKNDVLMYQESIVKPAGGAVAGVNNKLRFGSADEPVSGSPDVYWRTFPVPFYNMWVEVNGNRFDWAFAEGVKTVDSTPSGNPMNIRFADKTVKFFS